MTYPQVKFTVKDLAKFADDIYFQNRPFSTSPDPPRTLLIPTPGSTPKSWGFHLNLEIKILEAGKGPGFKISSLRNYYNSKLALFFQLALELGVHRFILASCKKKNGPRAGGQTVLIFQNGLFFQTGPIIWFGQEVRIRSPNVLRGTLGKALVRISKICGPWFRSYSRRKVIFYVLEYRMRNAPNLGIDCRFGNLTSVEND